MVYVEDLSRNGAYFRRVHFDDAGYEHTNLELLGQAKGSVPFLHGDRLFLDQHAGVYVELQMESCFECEPIPSLMEEEIEVMFDPSSFLCLVNSYLLAVSARLQGDAASDRCWRVWYGIHCLSSTDTNSTRMQGYSTIWH